MAELIIRTPEDVKKLEGWKIEKAEVIPPGRIMLKISHPAASCHVQIVITPGVTMGLSGNIVLATSGILIEGRDVVEDKGSDG